jgi:hypothetical protein
MMWQLLSNIATKLVMKFNPEYREALHLSSNFDCEHLVNIKSNSHLRNYFQKNLMCNFRLMYETSPEAYPDLGLE